ncbi:hypothetical protein MASR1M12_11850 [Erysipelotrichia bacterium]
MNSRKNVKGSKLFDVLTVFAFEPLIKSVHWPALASVAVNER